MKLQEPAQTALKAVTIIITVSFLAGCVSTSDSASLVTSAKASISTNDRYAAVVDKSFTVPAVPAGALKQRYVRQLVRDPTGQVPGTVVVDPANRFLYLIQENGEALRYGVGVGREGMAWSGTAIVGTKREWPHWTPTPDMIRREPKKYSKLAKGMDGGTSNPLGARALYQEREGYLVQNTRY